MTRSCRWLNGRCGWLGVAITGALLALAIAVPVAAQAPPPHDPQTQMLPDARGAVAWSLLSSTAIKKIGGKLGPEFPPALRPLNGKTVKLQGYILPLEPGLVHQRFLLSAWSPSCPFCLTAGPEAMVEIRARTPVKYSIDPVTVEGRLALLDDDPNGLFYRLLDAAPSSLP